MHGVLTMATNKQDMQPQDIDTLWDTVSEIVDQLQFATETSATSVGLIQKLLTFDRLPGIRKKELSIVYCEYGTQEYKLIVYAGQEINRDKDVAAVFKADNQAIQDVAIKSLSPEEYPWFKTKADCTTAGFDGFGTVMIVPMRLGRHRRLGAFIIHSEEENAYSNRLQRVMDVLSDRLAALIRSLRRRLRDDLAYKLRNELLGRLTSSTRMFEGECEILKHVLEHLKNWYEQDHIHILIKNPLDIDNYYQATDEKGNIRPGFRTTQVLDRKTLLQIMAGESNLKKLATLPKDFTAATADALHGVMINDTAEIPDFSCDYKSWLGVTMHHPDGYAFGHIVLHDTGMPYAYDHDDLRFMDAIADFLGFLLAEYRTKQKKAVMRELTLLPLDQPQQLYNKVAEYLFRFYGVEKFEIRTIEFSSQEWELVWPIHAEERLLPEEKDDFQNKISQFVSEHRIISGYKNKPLKYSFANKNYLITPMRAGNSEDDGVVAGAFVIPANNPGGIASNVIDEVSDVLGRRLQSWHSQQRYMALTAFINNVSCLASTNLTQNQVLQIAYEHIQRVMFSANVYIALYDETEDSISFPLIYRNGKVWEEMHNQKRKIDPSKLGRTEVIIRDPQPLLIKTKEASEAWYKEPNHKEHAGNPLASWIGVPIFAASEEDRQRVRGVIAAYHDDLDYVYSVRDVFFLQNVAGAVAGLFRLLENQDLKEANRKLEEAITNNTELKEANRKLEEAKEFEQKLLAESTQQEELAKTFILMQLSSRVTDSILDLERAINFSIEDIKNYQRFKENSSLFRDTLLLQKDAIQSVAEIKRAIKDVSPLDTSIKESINVSSLFEDIIQEIDGYKYLAGNTENSVEFLANRENFYIAMFNFSRNVINFLKKLKIQASYKLYKYENSIFIDIELDKAEDLLNELQPSILIAQKRVGANIFLHEKSTIRFSINLNIHEESILIIGGKTVDKRTLQDTLSKLGEKSRAEDDISNENHLKVIFILDNREIKNSSLSNAKIVAFTKADNVDRVIDKTKLDNEDYLRDLLKDIKYYD